MTPHENQGKFDPDSKPSHLSPPHKTKPTLLPTLMASQLRSPTLKSRLFRLPTQQQSISMPTLHRVIFGPCYFACYTHQYMFFWYRSNTYNIITSTNSQNSWRCHNYSKNPIFLRKFPSIFLLRGIIHDYVWYWWPDFVTFHSSCM